MTLSLKRSHDRSIVLAAANELLKSGWAGQRSDHAAIKNARKLIRYEQTAAEAAERRALAEEQRANASARRQHKAASTHVYVIGAGGLSVKIGRARDPMRRLAQIQTGHPERLRLYLALNVGPDLALAVEKEAHRRLADYRQQGEWFGLSADDAEPVVRQIAKELQELAQRPTPIAPADTHRQA